MFKNERRVFRGRGGPNDRRLPKHNARRRRKHPPCSDPTPGAATTPDGGEIVDKRATTSAIQGKPTAELEQTIRENLSIVAQSSSSSRRERHEASIVQGTLVPGENDRTEPAPLDLSNTENKERRLGSPLIGSSLSLGDGDQNEILSLTYLSLLTPSGETREVKYRAELDHLRTRIANNRRTMQQSASALQSPENYQKHVLDAINNTVREYRAIFRNYMPETSGDDRPRFQGDSDVVQEPERAVRCRTAEQQQQEQQQQLFDTDRKALGNELFSLIQQALQCGPLAGSKPGYMKRCDVSVVRRVLQFLEEASPDDVGCSNDAPIRVGFTSKQSEALQLWKLNAHRATVKHTS